MNTEVMKTETWKSAFKTFWAGWQTKKGNFENILEWWDVGKGKIRELTQEISIAIAKEKRHYEKNLSKTKNSIIWHDSTYLFPITGLSSFVL